MSLVAACKIQHKIHFGTHKNEDQNEELAVMCQNDSLNQYWSVTIPIFGQSDFEVALFKVQKIGR